MKQPARPELVGSWVRLVILAGLVGAALGGHSALADSSATKENQVKAAFLFNFAKFIEWPAQSFAAPDSPFVIAVLTSSAAGASFGEELARIVKDRRLNGREVVVKQTVLPTEAVASQMLFAPSSEEALLPRLREAMKDRPVLMVGESPECLRMGGVIVFVSEGDKLRFEINAARADEVGLKISAQLQKLALAVHRP